MKKTIYFLLMAIAIITFSSCASIKATVEQDQKAKHLKPEEGKALVYFIRKSNLGMAVKLTIETKGIEVGTTKGKTYVYGMFDPGKYIFTCKAENEADIILEVEANKTYYVEIIPKMGFIKARCQLEKLHPAQGKEYLQKCKLSNECKDINKL